MNICGCKPNARVSRRKFWVMGGGPRFTWGGHRIFGMGGTAFHGGGQGLDGGGPGASGGTMGTPGPYSLAVTLNAALGTRTYFWLNYSLSCDQIEIEF